MRRWLLALVLAATGSAAAPARDLPGDLDACIARLDHGRDVGFERIAARCPELAPELAQSEWSAWLPRDWNTPGNKLSAEGLAELRTLVARAAAPARAAHAPDVASVAAVLERVTRPDTERGGWWARFKRWLHTVLEPRPQRAADGSWLRRLFGNLNVSDTVLEGLSWAALALVVVLAFAVISNELRVAGLLGRARQRAPTSRLGAAGRAPLTLGDVEAASAREQPGRLLELVTERLAQQQRLPPARALTVRELTRVARLPQEGARQQLLALAGVCEGLRFSDREVAPPVLAAAVADGRELLALLEHSAAQPHTAAA